MLSKFWQNTSRLSGQDQPDTVNPWRRGHDYSCFFAFYVDAAAHPLLVLVDTESIKRGDEEMTPEACVLCGHRPCRCPFWADDDKYEIMYDEPYIIDEDQED